MITSETFRSNGPITVRSAWGVLKWAVQARDAGRERRTPVTDNCLSAIARWA